MATENIDYDSLKRRGFLRQKQDGYFVARTRMSSGVYTKQALDTLSAIAKKYGKNFVHATTRQGLEIPFVKFENIDEVEKALSAAGIQPGTAGPRLRTVTTCPGNSWCKSGLVDTFGLAARIEKEPGIKCGMDLPHKLKISISGCPNACTRPDASDIGTHGQVDVSSPEKRIGYAVYLGGCGGREPRAAFKLEKVFSEDEAIGIIGRVTEFFRENARPRERLGLLIERLGKEAFLAKIKL